MTSARYKATDEEVRQDLTELHFCAVVLFDAPLQLDVFVQAETIGDLHGYICDIVGPNWSKTDVLEELWFLIDEVYGIPQGLLKPEEKIRDLTQRGRDYYQDQIDMHWYTRWLDILCRPGNWLIGPVVRWWRRRK